MRKTSRGPSARRGVRRGNDKYPGWKEATLTAPLGGKCLDKKNKVEQIQHTKDIRRHTDPYITQYHVTREQGTLVAPRLWAEEGVGRAKLNNDEKATALRLR